jgi:hypothetical protein
VTQLAQLVLVHVATAGIQRDGVARQHAEQEEVEHQDEGQRPDAGEQTT